MDKRKKNLRRLAALLAFLLVLAGALYYLDIVLTPKGDTMDAFYAEPRNTVDVLIVGSSHSTAAFDPIQMYDEQGITSFNLFSWSQPVWTSYHYVQEALKTQSPKVVVLEAFGLVYGHTYLGVQDFDEVSDDYSLRMRPSLNRLLLSVAMSRSQETGKPFYRYTSLLQWHNRWQALDEGEWLWPFQDHSSAAKGFGPNYSTHAFDQQVQPEDVQAVDLYPACEAYFLKLVELSQREGFQLVVAAAPYIIDTEGEWRAYQRVADLCAASGVPYLDYLGALGDEVGFDYEWDMAEHAHVNLFGAEKLSAHLGSFLKLTYDLPDRRGEQGYEHWARDAEMELADRARQHLRSSVNAARYLPKLPNERFVSFVVSGGFDPQGEPRLIEQGLLALGLPTGIITGEEAALLAIYDRGQLVQLQQGDELSATYEVAGVEVQLRAAAGGAHVRLNGEDVLLPHDGLFAVTLDAESGEVVHSVVFKPSEGGATRTD